MGIRPLPPPTHHAQFAKNNPNFSATNAQVGSFFYDLPMLHEFELVPVFGGQVVLCHAYINMMQLLGKYIGRWIDR